MYRYCFSPLLEFFYEEDDESVQGAIHPQNY